MYIYIDRYICIYIHIYTTDAPGLRAASLTAAAAEGRALLSACCSGLCCSEAAAAAAAAASCAPRPCTSVYVYMYMCANIYIHAYII